MNSYPATNATAAKVLGNALRRLGYTADAFETLLEDDESTEHEDETVADRRLPRTRLGNAIRALYFQLPLDHDDAVRALGREGVEAAEAIGLVDAGERFVARARIMPVNSLLIASDDFPRGDGDNPPDYVAAYTPTSRICDSLTPRRRVEQALDVGTGSGVLALLSAGHAKQVVATDINERALRYGRLNAALNGLPNVEFREGSLFEPVDGETFDLITCNAPYVVSPENRWAYRDSGFEGDEISQRVVHEAADHLSDDGFATLMVSWVASDEDEPDERPLAWADTIDCDSWILPVWGSDALAHAATWNEPLADKPKEFGNVIDSWTRYLERLGVRWVSEGAIVLHRTRNASHTVRVDSLDEETLEDSAEQIERAFASRTKLSQLRRSNELLQKHLSIAMPLLLEHELEPRRGRTALVSTTLQVAGGTQSVIDGPARALELVAMLDGTAPLEEVVKRAAQRLGLSEAENGRLRREVSSAARELLELGALRFTDSPSD
jgi:methylase of polypeptide subunit release factors